MKKIFLFSAIAITVALTSCKLDGGYMDSVPSIDFYEYPLQLNSNKNVYLKNTDNPNTALIDSIHAGDTLKMKLLMRAGYNQLTEFHVNIADTTIIKAMVLDSANILFRSADDKVGKYVFRENYSAVLLHLNLVAKKASENVLCTFDVLSDAEKVYNKSTLGVKTNIKPKR